MLSAHAYTFRQKSRLAISLSWVGGFTNVISLIVSAQVVSHMTGNTTNLGRLLMSPSDGDVHHTAGAFALIIGMFFIGATLSGVLIERADRRALSSRYIAPIAIEAALLAIFSTALVYWSHLHGHMIAGQAESLSADLPLWIAGLAAMAMGLQNATITKISGAVIRTTHVTGVVTDLGLDSVQLFIWWRDKLKSRRPRRLARMLRVLPRNEIALRVALLASIYGSFLFGVVAGTACYYHIPDQAMLAPILFLIWIVLLDYFRPIGFVREIDPLGDPELNAHGIVKALLPADLCIYRLTPRKKDAAHGAPNFQKWIDRVPSQWRVIILAVSPFTKFDSESIADLRDVAERLSANQRRLIISGVNAAQFRLMDALGLTEILETADFTSDLEFAVARAIEISREISHSRPGESSGVVQ